MKYIKKDFTTPVVQQYKQELCKFLLDEISLSNPKNHEGLTGRKLYKDWIRPKIKIFRTDLKDQMYSEQGGICCYCGLKIVKDKSGRKLSVEHVLPKCTHRELVGEYKNLLLCCTEVDADANDMGLVTNDSQLHHCGKSKDNKVLSCTPLQPECESRYSYDAVGNVSGDNADIEQDISILNLNCEFLKKRRKEALSILFDENGALLSDKELKEISHKIMQPNADGMFYEFCFVIKQVVDSFIG